MASATRMMLVAMNAIRLAPRDRAPADGMKLAGMVLALSLPVLAQAEPTVSTPELSELLERLRDRQDRDLARWQELEFRRGEGFGANAFALPSGTVVMTDELVELFFGSERTAYEPVTLKTGDGTLDAHGRLEVAAAAPPEAVDGWSST